MKDFDAVHASTDTTHDFDENRHGSHASGVL